MHFTWSIFSVVIGNANPVSAPTEQGKLAPTHKRTQRAAWLPILFVVGCWLGLAHQLSCICYAQLSASASTTANTTTTQTKPAVVDPREDAQWWPDALLTVRLNPKLNLNFLATARIGQNYTADINEQLGAGISWLLNAHISFATQYRHIWSNPTPTRRSIEDRFHLDFTWRTRLPQSWNVSSRLRAEWRKVSGITSQRYRNRLQFERPLLFNGGKDKSHEHRIVPYAAYEVFYDTRSRSFARQQIYLGTRLPLTKHFTFNPFYMHQFDNIARPGNLNVLGTYWQFDF